MKATHTLIAALAFCLFTDASHAAPAGTPAKKTVAGVTLASRHGTNAVIGGAAKKGGGSISGTGVRPKH